ncbi:elongation of very long chain fatty acids protein AAEL008004-like [Thrips palmi]|uniref:Elongation of very long chain fatty acids protein n=1 Tax=Thrips palmi TaxID=161013 RepID=A0A6P8Z164_THRPL|nr:elongation of very long chain fatty acids protein AAEL008004-like [Thrips palmi]XP_034243342.1 elongation of very long chain fatty acids protein AAEL008004-like [Thrips palmi]
MTSVVSNVVDGFQRFMAENGDPRTNQWLLMSSPWPLVAILLTYLWVCTKAGPRIMAKREPFKLTNVLIIYNFLQMVGSAWLFWEGLDAGWLRDYSYTCQPVDYSNDPKAMRMAGAVWWYFMFKIVELLDTVFFVLRKKNNQLSFLHMYHHTMMPVCSWIGVKFLPGGHGTLLGVINCLVHVIMYFYYMVAAMGPQYQKYLGWKSYVTVIQLVQFVIVFFHSAQVLFRQCNYPKGIAFLLALNAILFMQMFGNFFYHTYVVGPKLRKLGGGKADRADKQRQAALQNNNEADSKDHNNEAPVVPVNGKVKAH